VKESVMRGLIAGLASMAAVCGVACAEVVTETIDYTIDGRTYRGVLAYDDALVTQAKPAPGVLVAHEWWGRNEYAVWRATRLAEEGYVAFALDMYGLTEDGSEQVVTTPAAAQALATPLYVNRELMRARALAGLDVLRESELTIDDDLAAIGYCFGGSVVLELARAGAPVDAVVSFHGGLGAAVGMAMREGAFDGTVVVCHGQADEFISPAEKLGFFVEMNAAKADYVFIEYSGAVHAFTNPDADTIARETGLSSVGYDEAADRRSWQHMLTAFEEAFGG
jgi:dienelactone hydrolase